MSDTYMSNPGERMWDVAQRIAAEIGYKLVITDPFDPDLTMVHLVDDLPPLDA